MIRNPVDENGKPEYGKSKLKKGEDKFFLQPGEELQDGIKNIMIIHEDEALLLKAKKLYDDKRTKTIYKPGQSWML